VVYSDQQLKDAKYIQVKQTIYIFNAVTTPIAINHKN